MFPQIRTSRQARYCPAGGGVIHLALNQGKKGPA
jgi:hypothetical protein